MPPIHSPKDMPGSPNRSMVSRAPAADKWFKRDQAGTGMHGMEKGGYGGGHALVIGASTTGLVAAAALARHFGRVTVVERDTLPQAPEWRKGAPQSRHVHVLLSGGRNVMDHYLPGFTAGMVASGARLIDMAEDIAWFHSGNWKLRFPSGVPLLCSSKGFLEWGLRQRVVQIPNVAFRAGQGVKAISFTGGRAVGVKLDDDEQVDAELIVDAGGRSSRTGSWLDDAGFGEPRVTELPVDVGYSTRTFTPSAGPFDWQALLVHPKHPDTRCAVLLPIEGGRWQVTLVGWRGDHPPGDDAGFLEWTAGLATPEFRRAIDAAQSLEPVRRWRFPSNLRRHYERLPAMPDGLVVIGDACVSINPIYAQGMSHGAIGASILDQCLAEQSGRSLAGLTGRFQKRYSRLIDECWLTSTAEDYGCPGANAPAGLRNRFLNWYMGRINELTWTDAKAAKGFLDVMHFQKPPTSLFSPGLLIRALTH